VTLAAIAGVALIFIIAGVWYFWSSANPPVPKTQGKSRVPQTGTGQQGLIVGAVRENPKDGLKYVWIPGGTFMMGCSPGDNECDADEKPPHQVTITKGFWLGQTEVTVGAYKRFAKATGRPMPHAPDFNSGWATDGMPIVNVDWNDAHDYCTWVRARLPTEAEWEYAARGGSAVSRYGPLDEIAWYQNNSGQRTHDVAQKRPNGFGLYDVLGNVWEWVNDWYDKNYYQHSPSQDPTGPASRQDRVLRGGSWGVNPGNVRVSVRDWYYPGVRGSNDGFRCGGEVFAP
jgi:formylglycine-generating enzyme required for sulfatase activity